MLGETQTTANATIYLAGAVLFVLGHAWASRYERRVVRPMAKRWAERNNYQVVSIRGRPRSEAEGFLIPPLRFRYRMILRTADGQTKKTRVLCYLHRSRYDPRKITLAIEDVKWKTMNGHPSRA